MKYIQVALESVIPLFGYFIWEWSLYFILLFYFIDLLADEWIMQLRSRAVSSAQEASKREKVAYTLLSLITLASGIFLIHLGVRIMHPEINFLAEIIRFWTYEEMGIQQGILLVPLVLFAAYQNYRIGFLLPGKFKNISFNRLWKEHLNANLIIIACAGLTIGFSNVLLMADVFYVLLIIAGITTYKIFWLKN